MNAPSEASWTEARQLASRRPAIASVLSVTLAVGVGLQFVSLATGRAVHPPMFLMPSPVIRFMDDRVRRIGARTRVVAFRINLPGHVLRLGARTVA